MLDPLELKLNWVPSEQGKGPSVTGFTNMMVEWNECFTLGKLMSEIALRLVIMKNYTYTLVDIVCVLFGCVSM